MEQWWCPIILIYPYSTSSFEHPRFYGTLSGSKARNLIRGDASRDARSVLQWDEILYNSGSKNILMFLPSSPWLGISQPQRGTQQNPINHTTTNIALHWNRLLNLWSSLQHNMCRGPFYREERISKSLELNTS